MKRRGLFAAAGGLVVASHATLAQPARVPRIGVMFAADEHFFPDLMREALAERGWPPARYALDIRSGGGRGDLLDALAKDLVAARVDVIVSIQTPAGLAAQRATREIPIVVVAGDPVSAGLVASAARPGGNITGADAAGAPLQVKRLELLKEMLPNVRRVGVLLNPVDPFNKPYLAQTHAAAPAFGVAVEAVFVAPGDVEGGMRELLGKNVDGVLVQPSLPLPQLAPRLRAARLPAISAGPAFIKAGGLLSLHANNAELYRFMAVALDRILKGIPPRDIPLMQANRFDMLLNLATAKLLGLALPPAFVHRADEVIE